MICKSRQGWVNRCGSPTWMEALTLETGGGKASPLTQPHALGAKADFERLITETSLLSLLSPYFLHFTRGIHKSAFKVVFQVAQTIANCVRVDFEVTRPAARFVGAPKPQGIRTYGHMHGRFKGGQQLGPREDPGTPARLLTQSAGSRFAVNAQGYLLGSDSSAKT